MADVNTLRVLALALGDSVEKDHHGFPSFRTKGKIFATIPDEDHAHLMLGEERIRELAAAHPERCEEKWWGKKLTALRISLGETGERELRRWLAEAHGLR